MMFWLLVILVLLFVLLLLLRPWSHAGVAAVTSDDPLRISIYRQNLRELDREFERGQLTAEQLANVRNELELSLLAELERSKPDSAAVDPGRRRVSRWSVALPVVMLTGLSIPLYLYLGNPQLNELKQYSRLAEQTEGETPPPLDGVIPEMLTHLQKNPGDANGWLLLSDMYATMQQFAAAVDALESLYRLTGDDPDVMLRLANALVMAHDGKFGGRPAELAQRVLGIEPENYTALLFAGMASDEAGDYKVSNQYYRRLLPALKDNAGLEQTITQLIARNDQLLRDAGIDPEVPVAAAETVAVSLRVSVSVATDLAGKFGPEDTLFVYAQAIDGPPMPLAVVRNRAGALPVEVTLDDSMAMMPAMKLSAFPRVKLQARISKSGNAQPESGDLTGLLADIEIATSSQPLNLVIDTVMP
jgi:cytochrome c-type biogenesis protein CcmH